MCPGRAGSGRPIRQGWCPMARRIVWPGLVVPALLALVVALASPAGALVHADWPAYLYGADHSSYNAQATAITTTNAGTLTRYWRWTPGSATVAGQPRGGLYSSPTVYQGQVYIGANNGVFYALDL